MQFLVCKKFNQNYKILNKTLSLVELVNYYGIIVEGFSSVNAYFF